MNISLGIPHSLEIPALSQPWERELQAPDIARAMQLADQLGFHSAILGEHFLIPEEHIERTGAFWHHSTVALGVIAGMTHNLRLKSSVTLLPLQNPIIQAKAWSTLDWLSSGRATATFGSGWLEKEFGYLQVPYKERGRLCDEYIEAIIALWTQEAPSYQGQYIQFDQARYEPKPIQKPHVPIWFGGDSPAALERVAKWGQGWSVFLTPPEKIPDALDRIHSSPHYRQQTLEVYFPLAAMRIGHRHVERDGIPKEAEGSWNAAEIIDLCGRLAALGVTETSIPTPQLLDFQHYLDRLSWIGEEIIPQMHSL